VLPLRDEQTVSESHVGTAAISSSSNPSSGWLVGGLLGFKPTFVEGLETIYLVIILGMAQGALTEATVAASVAYLLVGVAAFVLWRRSKLVAIPQNTLKCVLSIQMLTLGTVWVGSALGATWWRENLSYFLVGLVYAGFTFGLVKLLRSLLLKSAQQPPAPATFRVCNLDPVPTSALTPAQAASDYDEDAAKPTFWEQVLVLGNNNAGSGSSNMTKQKYSGRYVGAKAQRRIVRWLGQSARIVYKLFFGDRLILLST
jgi:hypothetical protein